MIEGKCEEVALEAEVTNQGALKLYQGLGFIRDKRLHRCACTYFNWLLSCVHVEISSCIGPHLLRASLVLKERSQAMIEYQV